MTHPTLEFIHRGGVVSRSNVPPTHTLLQLLRDDLGLTATKEGCNQGDCGACTVVLGEKRGQRLHYSAVNSCLRLAHSINGMALWTAADLADSDGTPHPVQLALLQCHASQCGFCTPGVAMSLFGLYQNQVAQGQCVSRTQAQEALSGNLCRCTGYRPILQAAQQMQTLPKAAIDTLTGESRVLRVDILHDVGRSINPAIDIGQIESGFVQGMGWLTTEELVWDAQGALATHASGTYKIPTAGDLPAHFNVTLWDAANTEDNVGGSKAVGEPPLMLALSVFEALRDAVARARNDGAPVRLNAPATPEAVWRALQKPE